MHQGIGRTGLGDGTVQIQPEAPGRRTIGSKTLQRLRLVATLLVLCMVALAPLPGSANADPLPRKVIAISNGGQFGYTLIENKTRSVAETPLNHLGLKVVHHDWHGKGAPPPEVSEDTRGALVWFTGSYMEQPDAFLDWATEYMAGGRWLVLAGDFAFLRDPSGMPATPEKVSAFFDALGVELEDRFLDDFEPLEIARARSGVIAPERPLPDPLPSAPVMTATGDDADVFLSIADSMGARSDVVARTRGGGLMFGAYTHKHYSDADLSFWFIDPIAVFRSAFRMDALPIPDTTTLVGRRIYTSHVDGDGWGSVSLVSDQNGVMRSNAEVMLDQLIRPYPDLPVSIGAISGDLEPSLFGTRGNRDVAREIFAQPQVELATHTHTHPFDWGFYRPTFYDPETEAKIFGGRSGQRSLLESQTNQFMEILADREPGSDLYQHEDYTVPRAYYDGPFNIAQEIDRSVEIIESLAPEGKRVKIVLWSGNTSPFREVLAHVRERGLMNMNGGGTRFDKRYPSLSYVSPLTREVDGELQVFTATASEAFYTDYWTRRFYGFRDLIETLENTGAPVRLRPVQLYYHTYSVERPEALDAVLTILEHVRSLDVVPIEASRYAAIVKGALTADIEETESGWRIRNRGALNTIRFDTPQIAPIDYAGSVGVLGHRDEQGVRYVALDPAVETVILARAMDGDADANRVRLIDSRWPVSGASLSAVEATFETRGYGAGAMRWAFPSACTGEAQISRQGTSPEPRPIASDADGVVTLSLQDAPREGVQITLTCQAEGA